MDRELLKTAFSTDPKNAAVSLTQTVMAIAQLEGDERKTAIAAMRQGAIDNALELFEQAAVARLPFLPSPLVQWGVGRIRQYLGG